MVSKLVQWYIPLANESKQAPIHANGWRGSNTWDPCVSAPLPPISSVSHSLFCLYAMMRPCFSRGGWNVNDNLRGDISDASSSLHLTPPPLPCHVTCLHLRGPTTKLASPFSPLGVLARCRSLHRIWHLGNHSRRGVWKEEAWEQKKSSVDMCRFNMTDTHQHMVNMPHASELVLINVN
jgi:hypothetical protein